MPKKRARAPKKQKSVKPNPQDVRSALSRLQRFLLDAKWHLDDIAATGAPPDADAVLIFEKVLKWEEDLPGGPRFDQMRRIATVYYVARDAFAEGQRPTPADVAGWKIISAIYREPEPAALIAEALAAPTREKFLGALMRAIQATEPEGYEGPASTESFEAMMLKKSREQNERIMLGVDPDSD